MRRRGGRRFAFIGVGLVAVASAVVVTDRAIVHTVRAKIYERELTFVDSTPLEVLKSLRAGAAVPEDGEFAELETPKPFVEVDGFDEDAWCWSNQFSQYGAAGTLVFDANGDGRLDVYFCQDGQNWTRPTDSRGVLLDTPRYQHNGLYMNLGNDADGRPLFKQVAELARANDTFVEQELLVEDYLVARRSADDAPERLGRSSNVAVAADFNGDGRLDLLV